MKDKKSYRIKTLHIVLVVYIILFSGWWTHLLLSKNSDAFEAKVDLLKAEMIYSKTYESSSFKASEPYLEIIKKKNRQQNMIIAEASVYYVILLIGVWLVYRSFRQEIRLARQQRNFLLSITHELKSPIASIRLVLDTFIKRTLKPEQIKKLASNGIKEAERLHTLVNNILLAARLDNSKVELIRGEVDLLTFTQDVLKQLRGKYPNTRFNFETTGEIPLMRVDTNGLTSIELNLIENAVKYCPDNGEIDVFLKRVKNSVVFEVADKGIGISDKEKANVFKKFYRVGSEDTRKTKGTGLGLYIVKSLVMAHKGTISIRDNSPKGTIFSVQLPILK